MDKVIAWFVCRLLCYVTIWPRDKVCHCLIGDDLLMLIYVCANMLT